MSNLSQTDTRAESPVVMEPRLANPAALLPDERALAALVLHVAPPTCSTG